MRPQAAQFRPPNVLTTLTIQELPSTFTARPWHPPRMRACRGERSRRARIRGAHATKASGQRSNGGAAATKSAPERSASAKLEPAPKRATLRCGRCGRGWGAGGSEGTPGTSITRLRAAERRPALALPCPMTQGLRERGGRVLRRASCRAGRHPGHSGISLMLTVTATSPHTVCFFTTDDC